MMTLNICHSLILFIINVDFKIYLIHKNGKECNNSEFKSQLELYLLTREKLLVNFFRTANFD